MKGVLGAIFAMQAAQLVDSSLPTTRQYWRRKLGFSEAVVMDPRSLLEIVQAAGRRPRDVSRAPAGASGSDSVRPE